MKNSYKFLSTFILAAWLVLTMVTPAAAFDGRSGDQVVIPAGETVNDDLYVTAGEFVLDGTVKGDLTVFARMITINGKVDGDLMAAGQTVILNGEVTGSSRIAGSVLVVGEKASSGGDLMAAGYSLEAKQGSKIGRDVVSAGGQILLAGDVARNVQVATGAFDLSSSAGGNVKAEVGEPQRGGPPPGVFMPQSPVPIPPVKPGLTIEPSARVSGNLEYTQANDVTIPAGVVSGKVTRQAPPPDTAALRRESPGLKIVNWVLDGLGTGIALLLVGLLLLWLFPGFVRGLSDQMRVRPLPSLGWGVIAWVAFFFAFFLIIAVTIVAAIVFGLLTLGHLTASVIWLGILVLAALAAGFALLTTFVAKVAFGTALGRWILERFGSPLAEHRYWPMVLGVLITVAVIALLTFPFIPGVLGWLLNVAIVLLGLGALWLWGRERMQSRSVVSV